MLHSSIQTSVISTFGFSYVALAKPVILVHEACGLSADSAPRRPFHKRLLNRRPQIQRTVLCHDTSLSLVRTSDIWT